MKSFKKYIILTILIPLPFLLASTILMYIYDPLQIYHKPYFRENTLNNDSRLSAKVIIDTYDFDSYILGSSMLENTSAKCIKHKVQGNWVNISMSGSNFYERSIVLDYIFKTKNIKNILFSIESFAMGDYKLMYKDNFKDLYDTKK